MKNIRDYGDVLNVNDVKEILGVGYNTAYKLLQNGEIKNFKIGRERKIPKHCLEEYLKEKISHT